MFFGAFTLATYYHSLCQLFPTLNRTKTLDAFLVCREGLKKLTFLNQDRQSSSNSNRSSLILRPGWLIFDTMPWVTSAPHFEGGAPAWRERFAAAWRCVADSDCSARKQNGHVVSPHSRERDRQHCAPCCCSMTRWPARRRRFRAYSGSLRDREGRRRAQAE